MDIVKTNIESINGFVNVDAKVSSGTKFTLMLPLTLATIQALLFSVDDTVFAAPLVYVLEAVKLGPQDISTIEGREVIRLRGAVVPLIRLKSAFNHGKGRSRAATRYGEDETSAATGDNPKRSVARGATGDYAYAVIVRFDERLVGLAVDYLMELQDLTVKALGSYMGQVKGIAGVSVLGDGQVVLHADVPSLIATTIGAKAGLYLDAVAPA